MSMANSQSTALPDNLRPAMPSTYTFIDEMWRTRTVTRPRYFSGREGDDAYMRPTRPVDYSVMWPRHHPGPRTIAERAEEADLELWTSSSSAAEYEERKQALSERKRLDREALINSQRQFHRFPALPAELRVMIWKLALKEPTFVTINVLHWEFPRRRRCGTKTKKVKDYSATAMLPPLMLVNHESHQIASPHYKRAFCGSKGQGGVLAAHPTILRTQSYIVFGRDGMRTQTSPVIDLDDTKLVEKIELVRKNWPIRVVQEDLAKKFELGQSRAVPYDWIDQILGGYW